MHSWTDPHTALVTSSLLELLIAPNDEPEIYGVYFEENTAIQTGIDLSIYLWA